MKNKFILIIYAFCVSCVTNAAWKEAEAVFPEPYSGTIESLESLRQLQSQTVPSARITTLSAETVSSSIPETETSITPEIEAMARALKYNVVDIFRYVHTEIEYVPTYGLYNGATGCLLAGRGNDWDQAALLISLLRASGYTARYANALVVYPEESLEKWLCVDGRDRIGEVLTKGGYPVFFDEDTPIAVSRVWAEFLDPDSQEWIGLDPAYNEYKRISGVDLKTAMGYQRSTFISEAITGATVTSDFVEHLNEPLIRNQLTSYSTNLANFINTEYPNATIDTILGREYLTNDTFIIGLPGYLGISVGSYTNFLQVETNDHLKIQIEHAGIDESLYGYEIAGKRVTVFYNSEDGNKPELRIDGNLLATGTSTSLGVSYDCTISIEQPFAGIHGTDSHTFKFISGGRYLVAHDFESGSEKVTQSHNRALQESQFRNAETDSEEIVGGGMQITMDSGLESWRESYALLANLADVYFNLNYFVGILGLTEHGYYVDLPMIQLANSLRTAEADTNVFFEAAMFLTSGLEPEIRADVTMRIATHQMH